MNARRLFTTLFALAFAALLGQTKLTAAAPAADEVKVNVFEAMNEGQIDLKFIPQDATAANLIVENKTDKPLTIEVPAAFAAVPVQAQMMGGGMGGMGGGMGGMGGGMGGMGGGGGQAMGGGMGGMGGGMGGMGGGMGGMGGGMGGGFMRIAPNKTLKTKVTTVCLEHGKPDPNPRMKYTIVPLEKVTTDPRVADICKAVANRKVPQNTAQAAVWHYTDNLSWQELAMKNRVESRYTGNIKFFNPFELRRAIAIVGQLDKIYEESGYDSLLTSSSSESSSSSSSQSESVR